MGPAAGPEMENSCVMTVALTIIAFVIMLFFLITCHEFGHFLASRRAGVAVEEFGIGFPPRLFAIKRGQTQYSLNLIPLGAFVRPAGEDDPNIQGGLANKGPWTRMGVYAAGPAVNIVLALLFITAFYMSVVTTHLSGNEGVIVESVAAGSVAAQAGIDPGDVIVKIGDTDITEVSQIGEAINADPQAPKAVLIQRGGTYLAPIMIQPQYDAERNRYILGVTLSSWLSTVTAVDPGSPAAGRILAGDAMVRVDGKWVYSRESFADELSQASLNAESFDLVVERIDQDGVIQEIVVTLPSAAVTGGNLAGVTTDWVNGAELTEERYSPWQAVKETGSFIIHLPSLVKESFPLIRRDPGAAFIGPVGAAQLTVEVVKVGGMASILFLGGFISISLALFNFLPIPPLDGGGMLIALIEGVRGGMRPLLDFLFRRGSLKAFLHGLRIGKRLPQQAIRVVYLVGTILMVMMFVIVFYGDISRLIHGESFPGL